MKKAFALGLLWAMVISLGVVAVGSSSVEGYYPSSNQPQDKVNSIEDISHILLKLSAIPKEKTIPILGSPNAKSLIKNCGEQGINVQVVEILGINFLLPLVEINLDDFHGNLPYTINDILVESGLNLKFYDETGEERIILSSSFKKSKPNKIYFTQEQLIKLAI